MKRTQTLFFAVLALCGILSANEMQAQNENTLTPKASAVFTVADGVQVQIASSNVQYCPANKKWRFAEKPYDMEGAGNGLITSNRTDTLFWIDLFGWGTGARPTREYVNYGGQGYTEDDYADFATHFTSSGNWYTPTNVEWHYLLTQREKASEKWGIATVVLADNEVVNGLIILPDSYSMPEGLTFTPGTDTEFGNRNVYTAEQLEQMDAAGARFLPCGGFRRRVSMADINVFGYYWSATSTSRPFAFSLYIAPDFVEAYNADYRCYGHNVRLFKKL